MHHTCLQASPKGLWKSSGEVSPRKAIGVLPASEDTLVSVPQHSPASLSGYRKEISSLASLRVPYPTCVHYQGEKTAGHFFIFLLNVAAGLSP